MKAFAVTVIALGDAILNATRRTAVGNSTAGSKQRAVHLAKA